MAYDVPSVEPTRVTIGDTWKWTHTPDTRYPISKGWALSYSVQGVAALPWSASFVSNDGNVHTVEIPASTTAALEPGLYEFSRHYTGSGSYSGERYTERLSTLELVANPATAEAGSRQHFYEKMLAAVRTKIEARISADMSSYSLKEQEVQREALNELHRLEGLYLAKLDAFRRPGNFGRPVQWRARRVS